MNPHKLYLQSIIDTYPELPLYSISFIKSGQKNDILLINKTSIFRFPKHSQAVNQIEIETGILSELRNYITLETPNPTFKNLASPLVGKTFIGYPIISGEPLWHKTLVIGWISMLAFVAQERQPRIMVDFTHPNKIYDNIRSAFRLWCQTCNRHHWVKFMSMETRANGLCPSFRNTTASARLVWIVHKAPFMLTTPALLSRLTKEKPVR